MNTFLSCDWGTSSFRLRLIQKEGLTVLAEESNDGGIAIIFQSWQKQNKDEKERSFFYQAYILSQIKRLEEKVGYSLKDLPLLVSGMISSSIGMKELAYKQLPFRIDGSDLHWEVIEATEGFPYKMILISGAQTNNDVLRGEETLLVGCNANNDEAHRTYIFPGTHSKHMQVQYGIASGFKTYMTGEFFDLLATKSVLSSSVEKSKELGKHSKKSFQAGILQGAETSILHSAFSVRTNQLFKKNTPVENYHFLSGLLIGAELSDLIKGSPFAVTLVCSEALRNQYEQGLQTIGYSNVNYINADEALIKGQLHMYHFIERVHVR